MIRLLWIDDNLDHDLTEKRMALLMEDDIDSHFARNATEAYYRLLNDPFDIVIFDLRLPPGPDDMWNEDFERGERKFGFILLKTVAEQRRNGGFQHLTNTRFGVFTIEMRDENPDLFLLPIELPAQNFEMKTNAYGEDDFINFIRKIHRA